MLIESIESKSLVLKEVKSDITNKIDLLIEYRILNNSSHHLSYVLTNRNRKFFLYILILIWLIHLII